jgi:hypothetical protein
LTELLAEFSQVSDLVAEASLSRPWRHRETWRPCPFPWAGELVAMDDPWEPYRLIDPAGEPVDGARAFLRDLQGAGRSAATARSYGMDTLRWFRPVGGRGVVGSCDACGGAGLQLLDPSDGQAQGGRGQAAAGSGRGRSESGDREADEWAWLCAVHRRPQQDGAAPVLRPAPGCWHRAAAQPVSAGSCSSLRSRTHTTTRWTLGLRTEAANPPGLADDFTAWVRTG